MGRLGWQRLPSGLPYYGTLRPEVTEIPAPSPRPVGDELVEPGESGGAVGADVPGVDLSADPGEVVEGEDAVVEPSADDDADGVVGQADKPTRARQRKGGE